MHDIPYELLVDLAEGRLAPAEAAALRARIASDAGAAAELAALEELIRLMREDDSVDAPEHVVNRAVRLMRPLAVAAERNPLRKLVAVLQTDSWQTPQLLAGLRSVQAWPRALLLSAGDRELDLQIGPNGERWQIHGQVLGPEEPGAAMLSGIDELFTVQLNDLGEFTLPPVTAGRYTLTVTQGDVAIVVPALEIGPSTRRS